MFVTGRPAKRFTGPQAALTDNLVSLRRGVNFASRPSAGSRFAAARAADMIVVLRGHHDRLHADSFDGRGAGVGVGAGRKGALMSGWQLIPYQFWRHVS